MNALAYIEQRSPNSYRFTVDLGYNSQGKRILKRKTIKIEDPGLLRTTKRLKDYLDLELSKFQLELQSGVVITDEKILFSEFVETWLARHVDKELEAKSRSNYRYHLDKRIIPFFGTMRLAQIQTEHVLSFIDYLHTPEAAIKAKRLGSAMILYNYRVLRSLFNHAVKWKVIAKSPMEGMTKPREDEKPEMEVYDEYEIEQLFSALANETVEKRCIVMLAVTCGLRRGEIAGLEWDCIDLHQRTIYIKQSIPMYQDGQPIIKSPKTRKSKRRIAMPMMMVDQLMEFQQEWKMARKYAKEKWKGGGSFLFCHESGQPHDPHWITDYWIDFRKRAGLKPIRFHDLRHTAATWMIKQNVHPKAIAARLGHVNIKTTMDVYGHVFESVDQAAASVFDNMPTAGLPRGALLGAFWEQGSQTSQNDTTLDKNGEPENPRHT